MIWIKSPIGLKEDRRLGNLARSLDTSKAEVIGLLHLLWWWAIEWVGIEGDVSDITDSELADIVDWPIDGATELVAALRTSGFIDRDGHLDNWELIAGRFLKERERSRKRAEKPPPSLEHRGQTAALPRLEQEQELEQELDISALESSSTIDEKTLTIIRFREATKPDFKVGDRNKLQSKIAGEWNKSNDKEFRLAARWDIENRARLDAEFKASGAQRAS